MVHLTIFNEHLLYGGPGLAFGFLANEFLCECREKLFPGELMGLLVNSSCTRLCGERSLEKATKAKSFKSEVSSLSVFHLLGRVLLGDKSLTESEPQCPHLQNGTDNKL